jgi:hypothetical protein
MSKGNVAEAAHVIVAVGNLKEWRLVNTLGVKLNNWLQHVSRGYDATHLNMAFDLLSAITA